MNPSNKGNRCLLSYSSGISGLFSEVRTNMGLTGPSSAILSYHAVPAITDIRMVVNSDNPMHFNVTLPAVKGTVCQQSYSRKDQINLSKITKVVRVLGLMAIISYMVVILFTWAYANLAGYVYFSAGEPELLIKYPEWALGAIGILAAVDYLRKELDIL